jgi:hypothetical protein
MPLFHFDLPTSFLLQGPPLRHGTLELGRHGVLSWSCICLWPAAAIVRGHAACRASVHACRASSRPRGQACSFVCSPSTAAIGAWLAPAFFLQAGGLLLSRETAPLLLLKPLRTRRRCCWSSLPLCPECPLPRAWVKRRAGSRWVLAVARAEAFCPLFRGWMR